MSRFSTTYPQKLKDDVVRDALAEGAPSVAELVRRAQAGHYGKAGRNLKVNTAREWVALERATRDAEQLAGAAGDALTAGTLADRALSLLARELAREELRAKRPGKTLDVPRVQQIMGAAAAAERARGARPTGGGQGREPDANEGSGSAETEDAPSALAGAALERSAPES